MEQDASSYCVDYGDISYPKTETWKEGVDCCSWDGVACDIVTGQVIGLDLRCSWLMGSLSSNSSLFLLRNLQRLNLAYNDFQNCSIPLEFGQFKSLTHLNLSSSKFSGQVPSEISYLSKSIISLDLSYSYYLKLEEHTLRNFAQNFTVIQELILIDVDMSSVRASSLVNLSSSLTSLNLLYCRLQGEFPKNILYLPSLYSLSLSDLVVVLPVSNWSTPFQLLKFRNITFMGGFPEPITNLLSLKYLTLWTYNLTGSIPASIGKLRQLRTLDLWINHHTGEIPSSLGNFTQLEYLDLSSNQLSGSIPNLSKLSKLVHLDFSYNSLNGTIPSWLYSSSLGNLTQLEYLDLSSNQLSGSIPNLSKLSKLVHLDFSYNSLNGTIPSWLYTLPSFSLGNLTQLEYLDLSSNQLSGSIPNLSKLSKLVHLDFSYNSLNGTIPSWLYTLPSLCRLFLGNNQFTSHISEFQRKSLGNNSLQGFLPRSIFDCVNLTFLDLSSNNWSGMVELDMFSKLPNLRYLALSNTNLSLTANIKSSHTLPKLTYLDLSSCNLTEFPDFLRGLKDIKMLDLSRNRIQGQVPKWMWEVGRDTLDYLDLSYNYLTGIAKLPWKSLKALFIQSNMLQGHLPVPQFDIRYFFISNNSLTGEIPHLICNATNIEMLDLSENKLFGNVLECIGNFSKRLTVLDLARNSFNGKIPNTFAEGCALRVLNFNGNEFEGTLPKSIANCTMLEVLDVGNNKIKDTFPTWLFTLSEIKVVVLRSNRFYGPIHDHETNPLLIVSLRIFDIANNEFSDTLPENYIRNLKAMIDSGDSESRLLYQRYSYYQYSVFVQMKGLGYELVNILSTFIAIDLSNNKFQGEIPEVIGKLTALKGLNLSNNKIGSHIPMSMGNLKELEWLDLSSNDLAGEIPTVLTNITFLESLNLSQNKLVGRIPQGKQFNTFDNSSYMGNLGLCGFPLSKACENDNPQSISLLNENGDDSTILDWKIVMMGYGCGLVTGLSIGYIVFTIGKPEWLVMLVEGKEGKNERKPSRGRRGRKN